MDTGLRGAGRPGAGAHAQERVARPVGQSIDYAAQALGTGAQSVGRRPADQTLDVDRTIGGHRLAQSTMKLRRMVMTPVRTRAAILAPMLVGLTFLWVSSSNGAEAKAGAQVAWDKIVAAAKNEGALTIYGNTGYDTIFAEFEKKYPGIKVVYVTGRGGPD